MFIDTSVFVAILCQRRSGAICPVIEGTKVRLTSPLVRLEASMVLATRLGRTPACRRSRF